MANENIGRSYIVDLVDELFKLVSGIVVKREDLAQRYETVDTVRDFDYYLAAYNGTDTFESYDKFDPVLLEQAGLTNKEIADAMLSKMNIPEEKREAVLLLQRRYILENFEERNNYYRMLSGLPSMEDYLEIYIPGPIEGVDTSKPLHKMTDDEIFILTSLGYINREIEKYPTRHYLKFLGANKLDVIFTRQARRFDILVSGTIANTAIKERFLRNYEVSRSYILNNYYKRRFSIDQTYFDAYIGFMIMMNALVMTVNDSVEIFNMQEFINDTTVNQVLQSHRLDMFEDLPLIYKKRISDNIKSLIVSKGTDEVIFKIFKLFGFDDISVRKFILVKEHKKTPDGDYIFEYEDDGVTPKYDEMYDIYFSQIDIRSTNVDNDIRRPENKLAYFDVTESDIYWGAHETPETIRQRLLREDFNYIDTDYININTAYEMTKLSFEVTYFLSSILSLKNFLDELVIIEPFFGQPVSLFYSITMISALLSKKIGSNGEIITDPVDIATIYKFNFDRNINEIQAIMDRYRYKGNPANFAPVRPVAGQLEGPNALIDMYFRNKEIHDRLMNIMATTRDFNEYMACKEILEYIAQSKLSSEVYRKPNGTIASTYLDYLESGSPIIAAFIEGLHLDLVDDTILRILTVLEGFIQTERFDYIFVNIPTLSGENSLKTYMQRVINVFKAFTINIFSMSVTYDISDYSNNIKILDRSSYHGEMFRHGNISVTDSAGTTATISKSSSLGFSDELEILSQGGNN